MHIKKNQGIYHVLNSKERRRILDLIESQFGVRFDPQDVVFLINAKEKIFLANRSVASIALENLRVEKLGVYLGSEEGGCFRLSIEGSQIIGPLAKKNVVDVSELEMRAWLHGDNLVRDIDCNHFVILKHEKDYLGCGRPRNNELLNFIPKNRRILVE